jgi:hypothetical protein
VIVTGKRGGNGPFTGSRYGDAMRYRTVAEVEADLHSLRAAAERAGLALACVFSTSAEYEADLIRERRAAGTYIAPCRKSRFLHSLVLTLALALVLLML